jgi:hypothetical protein
MQFSNIICHMPNVPSLGRTYKQAGICVSSYQCSVWSWQEQWAMGTFVRLGPSLSPRPRAWFGPKENTKKGLHTTTTEITRLYAARGQSSERTVIREDNPQGGQSSGRKILREENPQGGQSISRSKINSQKMFCTMVKSSFFIFKIIKN